MIAVSLHDPEGKAVVRFVPQPDITGYQVALVLNLFTKMTIGRDGQPDWCAYLAEHGLERHFEPCPSS